MDDSGRSREQDGRDGQEEQAPLSLESQGGGAMITASGRDAAALMAHELRGPVGIIQGYASMLLDGSLDGAPMHQRMAAEKIAKHCHDLAVLLESLIISLAGKDGRTPIDLRSVVQEAVGRTEERAALEASRIILTGADALEEPVLAMANRAHVLCILTCLISNGLVYSPGGSTVVVELRDRDPAEIAVQDYGLGIPESRQPHVFERECRLCEGVDGFGLGLALSRELAERNRGTLRLESSEIGKGSTFVLALSRADSTPDWGSVE